MRRIEGPALAAAPSGRGRAAGGFLGGGEGRGRRRAAAGVDDAVTVLNVRAAGSSAAGRCGGREWRRRGRFLSAASSGARRCLQLLHRALVEDNRRRVLLSAATAALGSTTIVLHHHLPHSVLLRRRFGGNLHRRLHRGGFVRATSICATRYRFSSVFHHHLVLLVLHHRRRHERRFVRAVAFVRLLLQHLLPLSRTNGLLRRSRPHLHSSTARSPLLLARRLLLARHVGRCSRISPPLAICSPLLFRFRCPVFAPGFRHTRRVP
jgi:hypothetical protein